MHLLKPFEKLRHNTDSNISFLNISTLSMSAHHGENKALTTLMPKLTYETIKRTSGSFTFVKENIILEISDQQY